MPGSWEVRELLDRTWRDPGSLTESLFREEDDQCLSKVLSLLFESAGFVGSPLQSDIEKLRKGESIQLGDRSVTVGDVVGFVRALAVAEYNALDAPTIDGIRDRLEGYAGPTGLSKDELLRLYDWWHARSHGESRS